MASVLERRVTIFQGRRGRVSFQYSINKWAVVFENEERLPVKWSSFLSGRFRSSFWPYLCRIFAIWRENQTGEIKVFKRQLWIGFCTLCFCFPTKMLHLNAPFFPLKCSVSPKKSLKCSDNAHYVIIQTVFWINFKVYTYKKRASVASNNNNNVYKFINTAKRNSCIRYQPSTFA